LAGSVELVERLTIHSRIARCKKRKSIEKQIASIFHDHLAKGTLAVRIFHDDTSPYEIVPRGQPVLR